MTVDLSTSQLTASISRGLAMLYMIVQAAIFLPCVAALCVCFLSRDVIYRPSNDQFRIPNGIVLRYVFKLGDPRLSLFPSPPYESELLGVLSRVTMGNDCEILEKLQNKTWVLRQIGKSIRLTLDAGGADGRLCRESEYV